jgi:hypothetical protein
MSDKPKNPYLVLLAGLILPGAGHVLLGQAQRGLTFLFFTAVLGWVSLKVMPEHMSFFARHVGGIFIYGISVLDAYKIARIKFAEYNKK